MNLERLRNIKMSRNTQRSAFAESAYADAERRESSRLRREEIDEYNLLYYDDGTNDDHYSQSNVVHAEFQPLAGSSVVIIANTSKKDKVTDARTLRLMEERESLGATIESLGGRWVQTLRDKTNGDITHAIWMSGEEEDGNHHDRRGVGERTSISHFSSETLVKLNTCLSMNVPGLSPGQHWSEVDVDTHMPNVIRLFIEMNSDEKEHAPTPPQSNIATDQHIGVRTHACGSRRDDVGMLNASISETYQELVDENPDALDDDALKRAMELSMLDFALVHHTHTEKVGKTKKTNKKDKSPYEILGLDETASPDEIKNAYRRKALQTHPDKGGKPGEFEAVARAYRMILNAVNNSGFDGSLDRDDDEIPLKSTAHWDSELKEHRNLVREMYQNHGEDIADHLQRQNFALERLGLAHKEAGSSNRNEKDEIIKNSCFYLSLATSYLSGIGALAVWCDSKETIESDDRKLLREADDALIGETALQLKRVIEAAVLSAHPEWAQQGFVGEDVQAFSDFLVYILESQTIISDWAVVVFDTSSGFADIYKGQNYKEEEEGVVEEAYAASNTLTLRFVPGHYQPLVVVSPDASRPTLKQIISVLDECDVLYVVTDGAAPE